MSGIRLNDGEIVLSICDVPVLPGLIADALRVIEDPGVSGVEIESVILRDQALSARLLKVVNSAAYGFARQVDSIRAAVMMLGVRKIKGIAGAMIASKMFVNPLDGLADPRRLWTHSLASSVWAQELIDTLKLWQIQSSVMAALLHDIGIVLLIQYASEAYRGVLEKSQKEALAYFEVEQRELGTTHARVGATACAKWMLPVALTQLINGHHSSECPTDDALSVVMLADFLANEIGMKSFDWEPPMILPQGLLESLGIDDEMMIKILQSRSLVQDRVNALVNAADL